MPEHNGSPDSNGNSMRNHSELQHSELQDFIYNNPETLLPYLTPVFGECSIVSVEKEYGLFEDEKKVGSVDLLLQLAYNGTRENVPIEIKYSRFMGSMGQLRRYYQYIGNCSEYGIALVGSPKRFRIGIVDLKGINPDYLQLVDSKAMA